MKLNRAFRTICKNEWTYVGCPVALQGDPSAVPYAVENVKQVIGKKPVFGICMGHQLLGQAFGGETFKLKFGHHGGNHPIRYAPTSGSPFFLSLPLFISVFPLSSCVLKLAVTAARDECCSNGSAPSVYAVPLAQSAQGVSPAEASRYPETRAAALLLYGKRLLIMWVSAVCLFAPPSLSNYTQGQERAPTQLPAEPCTVLWSLQAA